MTTQTLREPSALAAMHRGPGSTTVFDVDEQAEDTGNAKRRRGRPRGTRATLVADDRPVTADDMRFLSAFCQGVDPRQAARTYLSHNLHNDGRSAHGYARQLLARLEARAQEHPERGTAVTLVAELQRRLQAALGRERVIDVGQPVDQGAGEQPRAAAIAPPAAPVQLPVAADAPSLTEFAARFDDGMYSEAELIELYEEEFGEARPEVAAPPGSTSPIESTAAYQVPSGAAPRLQIAVDRRIEILEWLASRLALPVTPEAPLFDWLEPRLAGSLQNGHGLTTLGQLARWVNAKGSQYYAGVPGLGRERALRLLAWLVQREALTGVAMRSSLRALAAKHHPDAKPQQVPLSGEGKALVPLEQLIWPGTLTGAEGGLRSREPNLMRVDGVPARDDRDALQWWLRNEVANKSPATVRAYRGAIERFVLWAVLERKKALSSMLLEDLVAFREFLYQPPAHWCSTARVLRACDEWRPLRGPLAEKAVRQVLDVVKLLYGCWHAEGYLRANPARSLKATSSDPAVRQRVPREPRTERALP